jgi:hypothetical protein
VDTESRSVLLDAFVAAVEHSVNRIDTTGIRWRNAAAASMTKRKQQRGNCGGSAPSVDPGHNETAIADCKPARQEMEPPASASWVSPNPCSCFVHWHCSPLVAVPGRCLVGTWSIVASHDAGASLQDDLALPLLRVKCCLMSTPHLQAPESPRAMT